MSPRSRDEESILRETMPALCRAFPGALVMRNEANAVTQFKIGLCCDFERQFGEDMGKAINAVVQARYNRIHPSCKFGLGVGSSDLVMVYRAAFFPIETKSARGAMGDEQKTWADACHRAGAPYILARSPEGAVSGVLSVLGVEQ